MALSYFRVRDGYVMAWYHTSLHTSIHTFSAFRKKLAIQIAPSVADYSHSPDILEKLFVCQFNFYTVTSNAENETYLMHCRSDAKEWNLSHFKDH